MLTAAGLLITENKKVVTVVKRASDSGPVKKALPQESPWTYYIKTALN